MASVAGLRSTRKAGGSRAVEERDEMSRKIYDAMAALAALKAGDGGAPPPAPGDAPANALTRYANCAMTLSHTLHDMVSHTLRVVDEKASRAVPRGLPGAMLSEDEHTRRCRE